MSFSRYAKYKSSGVEWLGTVPEHWALLRVGYLFEEIRKKVNDRDFPPLSVTKNGVVPQLETAAKTDDGDNRKQVLKGDLAINSRSDRKGSAGVSDLDGSVSLICTVLRPNSELHRPFVHHLIRSVPFQEEYYRNGKGIVADLWSTGYSEMKNILLPVPPIGEQQAIARFLNHESAKCDALIAGQERLIDLLKEKRQAVISQAVTKGLNPNVPMKNPGVEWIGDMPEHWNICQVRRVVKQIEQGWSPECLSRPAEPNEWGVLKTGCVNRGRFAEQENKALPESLVPISEYEIRSGNVLMSRANGSPELVGSTAMVETVRPNLMLSDKLFRIEIGSDVRPRFFVAAFNAGYMRSQIERAISGAEGLANNLPQSELKRFMLMLPPLQEQREIVGYISERSDEIDALCREAEACIRLVQQRRNALISAAVTGQIDVRGLAEQKAA